MTKKQSLISYILLLIFILCFLIFSPVQSQTPKIGITLTWSTDTYVPLNYPGKALPSRGNIIEVAANIDSKGINPQELNYRWFLNDHAQREKSGLSRQTFNFPAKWTSGNEYFIRIEIRNRSEELLGSASQVIKIVQPEIVLEAKEYQIPANQEAKFTAQPYFFNIKSPDELDYKWRLGGKTASQTGNKSPNIFILKVGQIAQSVKQDLVVWAKNKNNPLQRAQTEAEITLIP